MAKRDSKKIVIESAARPLDDHAGHDPDRPVLVLVQAPYGRPFWERHPDHPNGEVWVAGHAGQPGPAVQVARTAAVNRALKEGRLELVG